MRIIAACMTVVVMGAASTAFAWPAEWKACGHSSECVPVFALCGEGWIPVNKAHEEDVRLGIARAGRTEHCEADSAEEAKGAQTACVQGQCVLVPHNAADAEEKN